MAPPSDAYHITQPHPTGDGAVRAMRRPSPRPGCRPRTSITSTLTALRRHPMTGSRHHALKRVFGENVPLVSSTKSMTGHTLGAAGALESVFCILAMQNSVLPPTINLDHPDPDCDLDYVANKARPADVRYAMTNSLGFGGHNASLVFGQVAGEQDQKSCVSD